MWTLWEPSASGEFELVLVWLARIISFMVRVFQLKELPLDHQIWSSTMERNRNKKAKSLRAAGRKSFNNLDSAVPPYPPMLNSQPIQKYVRRFKQIGAMSNQAFALANGHEQFLVVVALTGNAVPYVDQWRIRKITIWNSDQINLTQLHVTAQDTADNFKNSLDRALSCISRSADKPGKLVYRPTEGDPLGSWHETSNVNFAGTLFTLTNGGTTGTIMDIVFDTVPNLLGLANGFASVTATTSLGTMGARPISGGNMVPQGINSLG
jgi:hypothetical protein